jgi:hypothetical protein
MKKLLIGMVAAAAIVNVNAAKAEFARGSFLQMVAETGCQSKFSDEKKADLYASGYKGRSMTVTGVVGYIKDGRVGLKILPTTLTSDIDITLKDRSRTYDLEKDTAITVNFKVSFHGGCILSYSGDEGVIQ